jgi:hypothetical protein
MKITNVQYQRIQGYPVLELLIDGKSARIMLEEKPSLYQAGLVFLGAAWEGVVPDIEFRGTTLRGFVRDPEIFKLYDDFGKAVSIGNFRTSPVI